MRKVLVVEDDKKLSYSIKELLNRNNFKIDISNTGDDALEKLKENTYNGIILDLNLSGFDGFKIIDYIKSEISNLPIIVYTGKELSDEEREKLTKNTSTIIKKESASDERLLDEVSLFLHSTSKAKSSGIAYINSSLSQDDDQLKNKKVLIVDDDIRNLYALEEELADLHMVVDKAPNGKVAIEKLTKNSDFDLVLMDIMMPIMDGYETMKAIRLDNRIKNIPIIAITAKAMKEDRQKCIDAGADDYLSKPIDMTKLINSIKVWIKK